MLELDPIGGGGGETEDAEQGCNGLLVSSGSSVYTGNIVGGGAVRVIGQGESQQIAHVDTTFAQHAAGIPMFTGGSEGDAAYLPTAPSASLMAAR